MTVVNFLRQHHWRDKLKKLKDFFKSEVGIFVIFLTLFMAYAWYRTDARYNVELEGTKFQQPHKLSYP